MLECLHTKRLWLVRVEFLENGLYLLCNVLTKKPRKQACLRGFSFLVPLGWFAQRANQTTTRYAGVRKKLYKKIPLSSTIRLFKS